MLIYSSASLDPGRRWRWCSSPYPLQAPAALRHSESTSRPSHFHVTMGWREEVNGNGWCRQLMATWYHTLVGSEHGNIIWYDHELYYLEKEIVSLPPGCHVFRDIHVGFTQQLAPYDLRFTGFALGFQAKVVVVHAQSWSKHNSAEVLAQVSPKSSMFSFCHLFVHKNTHQ